jgi:hypothetical protein
MLRFDSNLRVVSALRSPLNKSIYYCQQRLQGLCWGLLQRIWWPSKTLDHVQWALELLHKCVCVWHVCAGPVLTMGVGQVQRWGFRNRALHCLSSSNTRPCSFKEQSLTRKNIRSVMTDELLMQFQFINEQRLNWDYNSTETMQFWVSIHQWPNAECRWSKKEILE